MHKLFIFLVVAIPLSGMAQKVETVNNYKFKVQKDVEATAVQNQNRTSTCWSFSTLSFMESEVKRTKNIDIKLSEMWIVRHTYIEKAILYVQMHGNVNFDEGGAFHDVTAMIDKYGIVPEGVYPGNNYGEDNHGELRGMLRAMFNVLIKNPNRKLSTAWLDAMHGVLDAYLGERPKNFDYMGKSYTPMQFAQYLGIDGDNYVEITSFTHHPYNTSFIIEIPDNWMMGETYNLSLEDFASVFKSALDNGYSIAWGADVSKSGFSHKNGVAIVPVGNWSGVSKTGMDSMLKTPQVQEKITAEMRQQAFDNYGTTDDHGMHITGYANEANTGVYYRVKNSWGTDNPLGGYFYASEAYVLLKTTDIMVHKDALSKEIKKKLGIN